MADDCGLPLARRHRSLLTAALLGVLLAGPAVWGQVRVLARSHRAVHATQRAVVHVVPRHKRSATADAAAQTVCALTARERGTDSGKP